MRPVKIITDSCSDLTKELREKYDIDYARMKTLRGEEEMWANLDWEEYSPKEFYDLMRAGERIKTTQVNHEEFVRVFTEWVEKGYDIVYIACSSKQSASVFAGEVAAKEIMEQYPEAQIFCVDSLNASVGEGLLAIRAAIHTETGYCAKEVYDIILTERKKVNEFCTVHNLNALKASGRVKASAAFFGNLLGVKPIIIADKNGDQTPIKKVKGRANSLSELVSLTKEAIENPQEHTILLAHADCEEEALALKQQLIDEIHPMDVYVCPIGPIIGASIGPEALAVICWGKEVTFVAED